MHDPTDTTSVSPGRVLAINEDSSGNLWVGTENGICILENGRASFTRLFFTVEETERYSIRSIVRNKEGRMWFGAHHTLFAIGPEGRNISRFPLPGSGLTREQNSALVLFQKSDEAIWVSTFNNGIFKFH